LIEVLGLVLSLITSGAGRRICISSPGAVSRLMGYTLYTVEVFAPMQSLSGFSPIAVKLPVDAWLH
jgi:hypothetical protein